MGLLFETNTDAVIAHADDGGVFFAAEGEVDGTGVAGVFHGVGEEVDDGLFEGITVCGHGGNLGIGSEGELEATLGEWIVEGLGSGAQHIAECDGVKVGRRVCLVQCGRIREDR